LTKKKKG